MVSDRKDSIPMADEGSKAFWFGPKPDMLPPDTDLVGRDHELSELRRFLMRDRATAERNRVPARVSIIGVAGVGKSALGTKFAYSLEPEYPDGALYVNL